MQLQHDHVQELGATIAGERRSKTRYALNLPLTYRIGTTPFVAGRGRTIDMSSTGIAFTIDEDLHVGTHVELSIDWPALLDHACPLKLIVEGKLVRKTESRTALVIRRIQFRTKGGFAVLVRPVVAIRPPGIRLVLSDSYEK